MCRAVSMAPAGAVPAGPARRSASRRRGRRPRGSQGRGKRDVAAVQARVPGTPGDRAAAHRAGLPFHSLLRLFDSAGLRDPQGEPAEDVVDDRMGVADLVRRPARRLEAGQGEAVDVGRERHGALQAERDAHRRESSSPRGRRARPVSCAAPGIPCAPCPRRGPARGVREPAVPGRPGPRPQRPRRIPGRSCPPRRRRTGAGRGGSGCQPSRVLHSPRAHPCP